VTAAPTPTTAALDPSIGAGTFFDDFEYADASDANIAARGWTLRTAAGGPGAPGAAWCCVSFATDAAGGGERVLQLNAATDGTTANTQQSEIFQRRKFYEGTYAARVLFTDDSVQGSGTDHVVEAFFAITPLAFDFDPNYGEMDFEYLPHGGWGVTGPHIFWTTWETYRADPFLADNISNNETGSQAGWRNLLIQVSGGVAAGTVRYYVDGVKKAEHPARYYPETPLSVNFNLWFIAGETEGVGLRRYVQQVDYFYYSGHEVLDQATVEARVAAYRAAGTRFTDTVPNL
jgi:hypothetical protein